VHPTKAEATASAAIVAPIFNVSAGAAWCPTHVAPPFVTWMQYSIRRSAVGIQPKLFTAKAAKNAKEKKFNPLILALSLRPLCVKSEK
jgi:hypothetical protein